MRAYRLAFGLLIFSLCGYVFPANVDSVPRQITLLTTGFVGPKSLGQSVGTILSLQVHQTLRKTGAKQEGVVRWIPNPLSELSHLVAEETARRLDIGGTAQIILWGSVDPYGDGAVVQAFVSIPEYRRLLSGIYEDFRYEHQEIWTVHLRVNDKITTFQQDIPRRRIHFEPIILVQEILSEYSKPGALLLYYKNNPKIVIGKVGPKFEARIQYGDRMLVTSQGREGIVKLPKLSQYRSEIVDYVSGLVRIFRGDWEGAYQYFDNVVENAKAPTDVRIDGYLYQVFARAMMGQSCDDCIKKASKLNPYSKRIVQYSIMLALMKLSHSIQENTNIERIEKDVQTVQDLIESNNYMFAPEDRWTQDIMNTMKLVLAK